MSVNNSEPTKMISNSTSLVNGDSDTNNNSDLEIKRIKQNAKLTDSNLNGGEENLIVLNELKYHDSLLTAAVAASRHTSRSPSPLNETKRMHRVVFTGGPCAGKRYLYRIFKEYCINQNFY